MSIGVYVFSYLSGLVMGVGCIDPGPKYEEQSWAELAASLYMLMLLLINPKGVFSLAIAGAAWLGGFVGVVLYPLARRFFNGK